MILTFEFWKENNLHKSEIPDNVDDSKLFESFISFCQVNKINNEHLELQSNHIKKGKIHTKVIRIENYEQDLKKHTNIGSINDEHLVDSIYNMFNWIRHRIYNKVKNHINLLSNPNIVQLIVKKYRMDFMIAGYSLKYDLILITVILNQNIYLMY